MKTFVGTLFVPFTIWVTQGMNVFRRQSIIKRNIRWDYARCRTWYRLPWKRFNGRNGINRTSVEKVYGSFLVGFHNLLVDGLVVATSAFVFNFELACMR